MPDIGVTVPIWINYTLTKLRGKAPVNIKYKQAAVAQISTSGLTI